MKELWKFDEKSFVGKLNFVQLWRKFEAQHEAKFTTAARQLKCHEKSIVQCAIKLESRKSISITCQ